MSVLPDEITEEILARLPAISLVRFNLVCKQWRSLISDPNFVRKHLNHVLLDQSNNRHHKLLVNSSPNFYSIDYESLNSTKLHFPLQSPHGIGVLGSCNGLLLLGFYNNNYRYDALVLWNPLLRDYNILPECSSASVSGIVRLLGFGYDSSIDDYKVVRVITNSGYVKLRCLEQKVEVFTLKTNSWRRIQGIPFGNVFIHYGGGGTLVNGSIYWVVTDNNYEDDDEFDNLIIGFDLIDEKFRLVRGPHDNDKQTTWGSSLVEVRGCLGLYQSPYDSRGVMIWMLKEDENKNEYWSKLIKIPNNFQMYCSPTIFFMKNDEVLLSVNRDKYSEKDNELVVLLVYSPENMRLWELPTCGISVWSEAKIYVETLVSPNGGRG